MTSTSRWVFVPMLLGVVVIITCVLLEVGLRVFDPLGLAYYADGKRYFTELLTPQEGFGYIHRANASAEYRTMDIAINGQGFRWTEFPESPGDESRIIILGDSVVFGWGVAVGKTFPARLQQSHPSVEILGAGVASWNTRSEYEWLERIGIHYDPDVVVLVVTTNDVIPHAPMRGTPSMLRRILRRSFLLHALLHVRQLAVASEQVAESVQEDSPEWQDAQESLEGALELCEKNGVELVVVMYGTLTTDFARAFYDRYGAVLLRHGRELLRFPDAVYDHTNSLIDAHPNETGHALMAEWLGPVLTEVSD